MRNMRTKSTIKNIKYNFIFLIINLIITFVFRAIFIKQLDESIVGFNSLIVNLMGFLNIAELGVASAITYSLYRPIEEQNYKKINEIMILFKYYYRRIAKVVLFVGITLGMFLKFFVKGQIPLEKAYFYYGLFLINTVSMYFFMYKQTLIIANQKQYIVVWITNTLKIIKVIIQSIIIIYFKSYFYYIILEIIFNLMTLILIEVKVDKLYENINFKSNKSIIEIKDENKNILKNIKNVFFHKISEFLVFQTDGILISLFLTLKDTAIYANYMLIINGVLGILNGIMSSFSASIGSLVAEGDNQKTYKIFKQLYLFDNFMAIIISYCLYELINPFTKLWIGQEYLFGKYIVLILIINVYIQIARGSIEKFKMGYGIFWDKWAPAIEGGINLSISLVLVNKIGVVGLVIGTLISNILIVLIWKPYTVYKYGFKINPIKHIRLFANVVLMAIGSIISASFVKSNILESLNINNEVFLGFMISSIITIMTISIITLAFFILKKDFRRIVEKVFGRKIKKILTNIKLVVE